ncbi:MAG: M15 family metallopeptidase [Bacteroidetes bacterium]|nr:M15 family metallopeptidase [Bacteroidota bacterium]
MRITITLYVLWLLAACNSIQKQNEIIVARETTAPATTESPPAQIEEDFGFEAKAKAIGLTDIAMLDSSIAIRIAYSTKDNFTKTDLYGTFDKAYLIDGYAKKITAAQIKLKQLHPHYTLVIYDAARPVVVQQKLWDQAQLPESTKRLYLSKPEQNSLHNYGAAIDLAILDSTGKQLDFGSTYDFFGEEAQPRFEQKLLKQGKLTNHQIENRKLLRSLMLSVGFTSIQTEWWHYNACSRVYAKNNFKLLN